MKGSLHRIANEGSPSQARAGLTPSRPALRPQTQNLETTISAIFAPPELLKRSSAWSDGKSFCVVRRFPTKRRALIRPKKWCARRRGN